MHIKVKIKIENHNGYSRKENYNEFVTSIDDIKLKKESRLKEHYGSDRENELIVRYAVFIDGEYHKISEEEYTRIFNLIHATNKEEAAKTNAINDVSDGKDVWDMSKVNNLLGIEVE